jgi:hypothetical protein
MSGPSGYGYGQMQPKDTASDHNVIKFISTQLINKINTLKPVKITAVHSNGSVAFPGTVDVLPLVSQVDGSFNVFKHGTVYGIPWARLQGGASAIICDPVVGDIGFVICADRDISSLKATLTNSPGSNVSGGAPPGSRRKYNLADGIYIGSFLNAAPTQYLQFINGSGIVLADVNGITITTSKSGLVFADNNGNTITMENGQIAVKCTVLAVIGNITATGTIKAAAGASFVGLSTHEHTANNTPPTPGI